MSNQVPNDGEPIPMSEFTLGERYSSADMYRDMGIKPGSRIAVEINGVLYTDTIQNITVVSSRPEVVRQLRWWQHIARRLTPRRFRKPLVTRPAEPATCYVRTGGSSDDVGQRTSALLTDMQRTIDGLTK